MQLVYQWVGSDVEYSRGLAMQEELVAKVLNATLANQVLMLEHEPVYTIGRTRDQSSLGSSIEEAAALLPHPVVEIGRGGQATYHGPGQLTGYPIVNLRLLGKDLHAYIRALEEALILTCAEFGVAAGRRDGLTGVWVENRKLASIGVGVRKWISMHGFAINVTKQSLPGFLSITPCGIDGVSMTSVESECGEPVSTQEFAEKCLAHLESALEKLVVSEES
ncbi:MAG: lipoyl(octanoyl) transferase LipB [Akkermansiaceae bacterium]